MSSEGGNLRRFCNKCGAPLAHGAKFCNGCGAQTGFTQKVPPPPTANSSGALTKFLMAGAVIVVLLGVLLVAGIVHVVHRAKQKASEIETRIEESSSSSSRSHPRVLASVSQPAATETANASPSPATSSASMTPAAPVPIVPSAATGDPVHDWALKYERTENGPEADLVVRTGDINNLGFGWPQGFDPFSGKSTPPHRYPWNLNAGEPDGTDRIMLGSAIDPTEATRDVVRYNSYRGDGYSGILSDCEMFSQGQTCKQRQDSWPQPITLPIGNLPANIKSVLVQMFADDFQAATFSSHFQVSLNGTRIPFFESALNSLDQTGPIGKLVSMKLLPEYWPLLKSGEVKLLIDDPTTKVRDGYAVDFVRILINPHKFKYEVSLAVSVVDADKRTPIPGANVTAGVQSTVADSKGKCQFRGLPAGLVTATGAAPGYDENSVPVDLIAGQTGTAEILLHLHEEGTAALERSIAQTGSATIYGIHFDTDSAKLRADSMPALNAVLGLIKNHAGSRWIIAGHTDNQGSEEHNQPLSERRAASVITWLKTHGVEEESLVPQGFGATRPLADNATAGGRALNRRVEIEVAK